MARAADGDRSEIDGEDVEGCFRAAHDRAGHARENAVGSVRGDQFGENAEASAAAERTHQGHGQKFRRETDDFEERIERAAEHVDSACTAEHADGHKNGDEEGNDAQGHLESFLRALDEFLVDRNAAQRGIEREEREEKRDGEDGESFDVGCEPSAIAIVARAGRFPDKVDKEHAENSEEKARAPTKRIRRRSGDCFRLLGFFFAFGRFVGRSDWRQSVEWQLLERFDCDESDCGRANRGDEGCSDNSGGLDGSGGGENGHSAGWDELHRAGVEREEGAHRVGRSAGTRIEFFQILHGAQSERCGCIGQTQHVGRHVHDHRSHGRVFRGNVGKNARHERAQ